MIGSLRVLAVVPARGGSKGIPLKNLRTLCGRSLVELVADVASRVPEIDQRVVSTDHTEIARVAKSAGLTVPFMRPANLAGDLVADQAVLAHALRATEATDEITYDIVVMLQPTSPLRTSEEVSAVIRMLVDGSYDSVWSVSVTDPKSHPLKQLLVRNGLLDYWDHRGADVIARQQLGTVYHRNGVAYAMTRSCLLDGGTIKGARTGAYVVAGERISIDSERDLELCEFLLSRHPALSSLIGAPTARRH